MNTPAFGKVVQYPYAVIADGRYPQPEVAEFLLILLQLDQLGLAIWSPIRRAVEQNDGALGTKQAPQGPNLAILVRQLECGHPGAHRRSKVSSHQTVTNQ